MSKASLLINDDIWRTLPEVIKTSRHIDAAIAYFGHDGARLFPLRRGDRLVVDMSPATVKAGSTDPHEIEKLIRRGVQVFTRRNLHAKIVIADRKVLVGSANVSKNSRDILDEAAILTDDPIIARRAKEFLNRICIEPVLPEYLAECKSIYKPPRFISKRSTKGKRTRRAAHAKLWLVNLVDYLSFPDSEIEAFEKSKDKALALLKNTPQSMLSTFHWPHKPKMADELEAGDWIIQCIRHKDKSISVCPPACLIFVDHYIRNLQGKERYVFHLKYPKRGEKMSWTKFRKALNSTLKIESSQPRTMAVRETEKADDLLRLWTLKGRVARK
jgi:hypothetical protein